uniref:Cell division protein n=1 Tax=Xylochloris irregularis TaxID=480381 RepID=A0A097KM86_9CHLO|nr:cell division protein [Xylochloris irregularis]AIT94299.1 cell division protein [Xylochloris irregularis]
MPNKPNLIENNETQASFQKLVQITTTVRRIFGHTFLPFVVWRITIQKSFSPLQKYQSYLKQHNKILVVHFIEMENSFREEVLRVQKEVNRHLIENNIEPIVSLEEYSLQVDSTTKNSGFWLGFYFVGYLLRVLTRYFIKKTVKDLFNTQLGVRFLGLLFLTFLSEGVIKNRYQLLPFEGSVPSFSVLTQRLSLETFYHFIRKEPNLRSGQLSSDQPVKDFRKPVLLERIKQFQRDDQISWKPPIQSVTLLPDSIVGEINELWSAANKQMYRGIFKHQTVAKQSFEKPGERLQLANPRAISIPPTTPHWYQLSPRRYMGVVPPPTETHQAQILDFFQSKTYSNQRFEKKRSLTHLRLDPNQLRLEKQAERSYDLGEKAKSRQSSKSSKNASEGLQGGGLTGWLKRFYLEMDEFPFYLSTQFIKTKRFGKPGVFLHDNSCLTSSITPKSSLKALTEDVVSRWERQWRKQYAPDLTDYEDEGKQLETTQKWFERKKRWAQLKRRIQSVAYSNQIPDGYQIEDLNKQNFVSNRRFEIKKLSEPPFFFQARKINRLSDILLKTKGADYSFLQNLENQNSPPQKKVFLPRRLRDPKKMKLEVRVQDPFPEWFPKWLHWLQYFGFRRARTPVSVDDLIPERVYQRSAGRDADYWGLDAEIVKELFLTTKKFKGATDKIPTDTGSVFKSTIFSQIISQIRLKEATLAAGRHRFLRKQQNYLNSQRKPIYTLNFEKVWPEYWTIEELTRLKRSLKARMFSHVLNTFFKSFEEKNVLELKNLSRTFLIEFQPNQRREAKGKKNKKDEVAAWIERVKLFSKNALFESRFNFTEEFASIGHKVDQFVDPAIEALELLQSVEQVSPPTSKGWVNLLSFQRDLFVSFGRVLGNSYDTLPSRRMSGYAYPDMETADIKAVYLQSRYRGLLKTFQRLRWKHDGYRSQTPGVAFDSVFKSVFKIDLPSTFLSLTHWVGEENSTPFIENSPSVDQAFLSKYKELGVLEAFDPTELPAELKEKVMYTKQDLFDIDKESWLDKLSTARWFDKLPISKRIRDRKEEKRKANQAKGHISFSALVNAWYEVEQNNKEEVERWLQRHFNTDNPASDLKQALLEFELRRHVYTNKFAKQVFNPKPLRTKGAQHTKPKNSPLPTTSEVTNFSDKNSLDQIRKRVGNWLIPQQWNLRPWLPTLDADPNDVVALLPPEVWERCLITKKPFIDAVLEGLVHEVENRIVKTGNENEYLNIISRKHFRMKKISRNELLKFFLPKVYYRRLSDTSNPPQSFALNRVAPMLDYASFNTSLQTEGLKRYWYRTTNKFVKKEGRFQFKDLKFPMLEKVSQDAPQARTEKVNVLPYSEGMWQQGSLGLDVVGGSYNNRTKLLYSSSSFIEKVEKVLSPINQPLLSIIVPEPLLRRGNRPDVWEPLAAHSWLVVYKLGYVWLCCKLMSDFYKKYVRDSLSQLFKVLLSLGEFDEEILYQLGFEDLPVNSRTFTNLKTRFSDIAAIDNLIPVLGEIVWFLRNRGRGSKTLNKGVLLVGPPGTGKTFLVQAIGGESKVPVLAQSGSTFYNLNNPDKVAAAMRKLFHKAQQIAPCLLFVDEIDSLGSNRGNTAGDKEEIIGLTRQTKPFQNVFRDYANLEENVLYRMNNLLLSEIDLHRFGANREAELKDYIEMLDVGVTGELAVYGGPVESNTVRKDAILARSLNREHDRQELTHKKVNLLLTFLTQLDGVKPRRGVLVIGATNRADTLDPAFMRPGRFDQVIHLALPGKNKRIEIFKFYSCKLGVDKTVSKRYWEYLANRTAGWSIADLAVAINQSAMLAIIKDTTHTIETLENGIETVINSGEKIVFTPPKQNKDPFFASRRGFYQAARAIVHYLLPEHPPAVVLHLFPQPTNTRENRRTHGNEQAGLNVKLNGFQPRKTLENRLIGFYAGKAGELIHLIETSSTTKNELRDRLTEAVVYRNRKQNTFFSDNHGSVTCGGEKLLSSQIESNQIDSNQRFETKRSFNSLVKERGLFTVDEKEKLKDFFPFLAIVQSARNLIDFLSFYHERLPSFLSLMKFMSFQGDALSNLVAFTLQRRRTFHSQREKLLQTVFLRYSALGYEDFKTASGLAVAMIEKWHLYSNALAIHKRNAAIPDLNRQEHKKAAHLLPYMEEISSELEDELAVPPNVWHPLKRYQIWHAPGYYLDGATFQLDYRKKVLDWYRIYLPNREQTKWNVEWIPPDSYYHYKEALKGVTSPDDQMQCTLNFWYGVRRDYLYRGLILNAFCKALLIVHNNRELLDLFAHHLLWRGILRQPEIETVMQAFGHHQQDTRYLYD